MASIESAPAINPLEPPDGATPARRISIVVHAFGSPAGPLLRPSAPPARTVETRRSPGGRHRVENGSWRSLAERVLHPWPVSLRLAVLLVVLATGTATAAAAIGFAGQLLVAALGLRIHRRHRRRMPDPRMRLAVTRHRLA